MLTQGPTSDPKCKLNISFLTLSHLSDCLKVEYTIIPYTSTFNRLPHLHQDNRLPHLHQEFYVHCIVIRNDGGMR